MAKTRRNEARDAHEQTTRGNRTPLPSIEDSDEHWLLYLSRHVPPESWPASAIKLFGQRASVGPWRRHHEGRGIDDWGAVPGTLPGAHRYYFTATRGRDCLSGTVVANKILPILRWLRDQERMENCSASRDPILLSMPLNNPRVARKASP